MDAKKDFNNSQGIDIRVKPTTLEYYVTQGKFITDYRNELSILTAIFLPAGNQHLFLPWK